MILNESIVDAAVALSSMRVHHMPTAICLDTLITAKTQRHEALKTHKKGLMQQLFPSPEESTP